MRCLYCDSEIEKYSLRSLLLEEDCLCTKCRSKLKIDKKIVTVDNVKIETFFDYDSIFKDLLIQYKECYDEALKDVFLYELKEYIAIKYFGYKILLVPSSLSKLEQRGFNHLQLVFEKVGMPIIDGLRMVDDSLVQEKRSYTQRLKMKTNYVYEGNSFNQATDKILIVDDVLTTGSSMVGAYNAVHLYTSNIKCICLSSVRKRFHFN